MVSLLADVCAGTQIQKVTDRIDAYAWLAEYQARTMGSQYVTGLDISQIGPMYDRLVSLSLEVLDARNVPIKKLLAFRKRELKGSGADYRAMRRRYYKTLRAYIDRVCKEVKTSSDLKEMEYQFKEDMKQDLADLKSELGLARKRALLSKEIVLSAVAVAGALVEPIAGLTSLSAALKMIGVAPLLETAVEYREARRKALRAHSMSWLFLTKQRRLTLR